MAITSALIKQLRDKTGAGMMDCKRALESSGGNIDAAIEYLRKKGAAVAQKRADRTAKEGMIVTRVSNNSRTGVIVEVNCETDFVARSGDFIGFAEAVAATVDAAKPASVEKLLALTAPGGKGLTAMMDDLLAKVGEKIDVRRFEVLESGSGVIASYTHMGNKIGVLVELSGLPAEAAISGLGRDVAMHVELLEMFLWRKPPGILQRTLRRARGGGMEKPPLPPTVDYSRDTLNELRGARLRAGTQLVCWAVDTDLTITDADTRRAQLSHIATAIEAARFLGASLLRIATGGYPGRYPDNTRSAAVGQTVDTLRSVLPAAMAGGVKLAIENHFGLSADPHALAEIVTALNSPHVGVCLDLGNFHEGEAAEGVRLLAPHAIHIHAKSYAFGSDGEETKINYQAAMQAIRAAGYDGVLSIEFEGDGIPADGIRKTKTLIERYWNG